MSCRNLLPLMLAVMLTVLCAAVGRAEPPAEFLNRSITMVADPPVKLVDQEGAGRLYEVGPLTVLVMEGTPREMGFQHGRLLAKKIHHIIKEGYMVKALWGQGYTPEYVHAQSERMQKHFPPAIIEELNGIVEGLRAAGVEDITYEDVRLGITQAEILHFPPNAPPACSNFAVWGRWTQDGRLLHGRNLDWSIKGDAQDDAAVLIWRPRGGHPFMMVGWAGGVGSVSGMNAKGLTLGEMTLPSGDATFDGLPLFLQMRMMLETCSTLEEAVKFFENAPRTTGWNFILGDAKIPDGRAMETDGKYITVFGPNDPNENETTGHWGMPDCVRRTNHPIGMEQLLRLARKYGKEELGLEITEPEQITLLVPVLQQQNTWLRYEWLGRRIEDLPGKIDVEQAIRILATGPVHADNTLHSFVFDPKNQDAWVAIAGNNPPVTATDTPFTRVHLGEWFK